MFDIVPDDGKQYITLVSLGPDRMLISDPEDGSLVVSVDLHTGEVTLSKSVSEASQAFWDAVKKLIALEKRE